MATKIKLMKLLQEMRGFSEIHRFNPPKPTALFLMQLRSHVAETSRGKRRILVQVDARDSNPLGDPVRIRYISAATESVPTSVV